MSCGSVGRAVRGFRLVNRRSAYRLRPTARELRPKQPGVGRTQDKRPQGSQQAPSCMTSIRRWPGIATCLTIIRPFPAKLVPEEGLNGYLFWLSKRRDGPRRPSVPVVFPDGRSTPEVSLFGPIRCGDRRRYTAYGPCPGASLTVCRYDFYESFRSERTLGRFPFGPAKTRSGLLGNIHA